MKQYKPKNKHRINSDILSKSVRIIKSDEFDGITTIEHARDLAAESGKDIVEMSEHDGVSIVRIIDYNKYLYQEKQKKKEQEKQNSTANQDLKEIRIKSYNISQNDIDYRLKQAEGFLRKNNKVRVTMMFKGREMIHVDKGQLVMLKFLEALTQCGTGESLPKLEGRKISFTVKPLKK